jgi:thioredoxin 1
MAGQTLTLKTEDMQKDNLQKQGLILVDFWATWCGPCRMIGPIVEQLAGEYEGKLKVGKLNVDEETQAAMAYGVQSIPTLILFKDGVEAERVVGAHNKPFLTELLEKYV